MSTEYYKPNRHRTEVLPSHDCGVITPACRRNYDHPLITCVHLTCYCDSLGPFYCEAGHSKDLRYLPNYRYGVHISVI